MKVRDLYPLITTDKLPAVRDFYVTHFAFAVAFEANRPQARDLRDVLERRRVAVVDHLDGVRRREREFRVFSFCANAWVFDAITDWPRVHEFMDAYRASFDGLGWFAGIAFWVVWHIWQIRFESAEINATRADADPQKAGEAIDRY